MMKITIKILSLALVGTLLFANVIHNNVSVARANEKSWAVYYYSNGGSHTVQHMSIYLSGGGYTATCTGVSGNCAKRLASIHATGYTLTKDVSFAQKNKYIIFNLTKVPAVNIINFYAALSYANGNSANVAGTLKGN